MGLILGSSNNSCIIRTLRLDKKADSFVQKEAVCRGISVNRMYNQLLEGYVNSFRLIEKFPCLTIPCDVIKEIFDEIPEQKIKNLGSKFGSYLPKHSLFLREQDLTLENVLKFMESTCQDSNWFQFNFQNNNGSNKLLLRHKYGKNWSVFLKEYYKTLFQDIFKIESKILVGDNSVVISFSSKLKIII